MSRKQAKTNGLEWLIHSVIAFNGSGYADYNSAEDYLDSYIAYKKWKKLPAQAELAQANRDLILPTVLELLDRTMGPGHKPSEKNINTFRLFKDKQNLRLL